MGLEQRNKSKTTYTTYTASAAIMLDCVSWGTEGQGVPMRRHGFLCTRSQSKDTIWGHMTHMWVFRKMMQEHHNGGNGH